VWKWLCGTQIGHFRFKFIKDRLSTSAEFVDDYIRARITIRVVRDVIHCAKGSSFFAVDFDQYRAPLGHAQALIIEIFCPFFHSPCSFDTFNGADL